MSAELCSVSELSGNHGSLQGSTVGGSKPLHRFLKGQPKITGTVVLILGTCLFIVTVANMMDLHTLHIWSPIPSTLPLGALFIASGIMYILTEHNTTKKTVTISLALSILCILWFAWTCLRILPHIGHYHYFRRYDLDYDYGMNMTEIDSHDSFHATEHMVTALESALLFHSLAGAVICIVMSVLSGAALRSTKSQAIVVMTTMPIETPAEEEP